MNNEGILSFYIGIITIKTIERSAGGGPQFVILHSSLVIPNSFQASIPQVRL